MVLKECFVKISPTAYLAVAQPLDVCLETHLSKSCIDSVVADPHQCECLSAACKVGAVDVIEALSAERSYGVFVKQGRIDVQVGPSVVAFLVFGVECGVP